MTENFETIVRTVFEDISKRLTSIPQPLLVHRTIFGLVCRKLQDIIDSLSPQDSIKGLFTGILRRFQIEAVWVCQLESLEGLVNALIEIKSKSITLHSKFFEKIDHV